MQLTIVNRGNLNIPYLYLIIGWEVRVSRMGPLRSGPRGRTDGVGKYKTPGMRDSNARSADARFFIEYFNIFPFFKIGG